MAINVESRTWSDLAISPGEILEEEIGALGMTQKELASRLGRPAQVVNEIIRGKKAITHETAIELEKVTGITAHIWVNLESTYQLTLARNRERQQLQSEVAWLDELPVRQMEKLGWINRGANRQEKVRELLRFFGVATVPAYRQTILGLRIAEKAKVSRGALAAWLRKGELEARAIDTRDFDDDRFRGSLVEIRRMTNESPSVFAPRLQRLCADAGVAVVVVRELPKTGANGVARWLTDKKVLIQLNLRYRWRDIFWFTFFHEACHVLKHKSKKVIIDLVGGNRGAEEQEADEWAADFLVPPADWKPFINEAYFTPRSVTEFGQELGIAPGIVVGRLQREGKLGYSEMTDLKGRFVWTDEEEQRSP
jgi:addiction module HigA family antidote